MHSHKVRIEIASNETVKQAVMAGLGLALIFAHAIDAELTSGRLIILHMDGLPIMREWYAVRRSNRVLQPAGRATSDFMMITGHEFLPKMETGYLLAKDQISRQTNRFKDPDQSLRSISELAGASPRLNKMIGRTSLQNQLIE